MRMAISIWEDRVSPVLDTALRFFIVEAEDGKIKAKSMQTPPPHGRVFCLSGSTNKEPILF